MSPRFLSNWTFAAFVFAILLVFAPASFAQSCGDALTADTTLAADLAGCGGNGLEIGADNIVLNCDGHSITGTGSGNAGVYLNGRTGVTVKNCQISGFNFGINPVYSNSSSFLGNTLAGNNYNFYSYYSDGNTISDNTMSGGWGGIQLFISDSNTLSGNTMTGNNAGLTLYQSNSNSIVDNSVVDNNFNGVYIYSISGSNTLTGNTITGNGGTGLLLSFTNSNSISNNTISGNGEYGIFFEFSESNTFHYDKILSNPVDIHYDSYSSGNDLTLNYFGGQLTCDDRSRFENLGIGSLVPYYVDEAMTDLSGTAPTNCQPVCGEVLGESVTLTQNLSCSGDGLVAGADNIVLDCDGYSITGSGGGNGVTLSGRTGVTVKNCDVSNFDIGVYLSSSSSNTLTGNAITDNNNIGIYLLSSNSNAVNQNKIHSNRFYDIVTQTSSGNDFTLNYLGGELTCADRSRFKGVGLSDLSPYYTDEAMTATATAPENCQPACGETIYDSVTLTQDLSCFGNGPVIGADNVVLDCDGHSITGFGSGYGVSVSEYVKGVTIKDCSISHFADGIHLIASDSDTLTGNTLSSNSNGINLVNSHYNTLSGNTLAGNGNGIALTLSRYNALSGNTVSMSANGITLSFFSMFNSLSDNIVTNVQGNGISFSSGFFGGSPYNTLDSNEFCLAGGYDIYTQGSSNSGDENICDKPDGWNDDGTTGCTYSCDGDGDGLLYKADNCPAAYNPDQADWDSDGVGDVCDDSDNDGVFDSADNCRITYNPDQADWDSDGIGDACDDSDNDGFMDDLDKCRTVQGTFQGCPCAVQVEVTTNSKGSKLQPADAAALAGQQPLENASVKVFDWTDPTSCAAQSRPSDSELDCDSVNSCMTGADGKCVMGLLCERNYDILVESPPAQGQTVARRTLENISSSDPQPIPVRISYREASLNGGLDVMLPMLAIASIGLATLSLSGRMNAAKA